MVLDTHSDTEDTDHPSVTSSQTDADLSIELVDEPPKLKYHRIKQLPTSFFRDAISTCTFHEHYFVFATHLGFIHITRPDLSAVRTFKAHRALVLLLHTDGTYFALGLMDGTVVIGLLVDEKDMTAYDFKRPIHAVVLDNYAKTRSFVSGGMAGSVVHSSKNWLGNRVDVTLQQGQGPIVCIHSAGDIILWMNDAGITIYHTPTRRIIKSIARPGGLPRGDLYWPRVHVPELNRILVAWGNYVWLLVVSVLSEPKKYTSSAMSFRSVAEKRIEVEHVFRLDDLVAGIASFKDDLWMILTFTPPDRGDTVQYHNPDLKLINGSTGSIEHEEEIGLRDVNGLGLNDYVLGSHIGDQSAVYYIISAKDGVVAQETTLSDRVDWYVHHEMYYKAWAMSEHFVSRTKRISYGISYVDLLVKADEWATASAALRDVLAVTASDLADVDTHSTVVSSVSIDEHDLIMKEVVLQWTMWADIFIKAGRVTELTNVIPTTPKLGISPDIYTRVLEHWVSADIDVFLDLVAQWDTDLYNIRHIELTLETLLENNPDKRLRRALANLYVRSFEPVRAVPHLMHLNDTNLVHFLSEHHLLLNYVDELPSIVSLRFGKNELRSLPVVEIGEKVHDVVDVLVQHRHEIPPATIVRLMSLHQLDFLSYFYLEKLNSIDPFLTTPFGDELIKLYATYERAKLLPFLTKFDNYDLNGAVALCEANQYTEELVYLLGKIGENRKALMLIINELNDPEKAIRFAKHQNDKDAWRILLDYSLEKPKFIKALIETADDQSSEFYDPIDILERMSRDVVVEGLKDSVTKISTNNDMNLLLNQLILKVIHSQSEEVAVKYTLDQLRGHEVDVTDEVFNHYKTVLIRVVNDHILATSGPSASTYTSLGDKIRHVDLLRE